MSEHKAGGSARTRSKPRWPDEIELGDRIEIDGHGYEAIGTGPAEATLVRVDDDRVEAEVFRWAFSGDVGIQITKTVTQEEFERSLHTGSDRDTSEVKE